MPSFKQRLTGIAISAVILTGGAYMAHEMPSISEYVISYNQPSTSYTSQTSGQNSGQALDQTSSETGGATTSQATATTSGTQKHLSVTINGIERTYGKVIVMIYGDEESFYNYDPDGLLAYKELPVTSSSVSTAFKGLKEGPYVISFFQDEDGDGDLTMMGDYPVEGYGGSGMDSPYDEPSFEAASVFAGSHSLKMQYLK